MLITLHLNIEAFNKWEISYSTNIPNYIMEIKVSALSTYFKTILIQTNLLADFLLKKVNN